MKATINGITYEGTADELKILQNLDQTIKGKRITYKEWTARERLELIMLVKEKTPLKKIAEHFGRTEQSIASMITRIRTGNQKYDSIYEKVAIEPPTTPQPPNNEINYKKLYVDLSETIKKQRENKQKRQAMCREVGLIAKELRAKGMEFRDSMKQAWVIYNANKKVKQ